MKENDFFAQIAAAGIKNDGKDLIIPQPPCLPERFLPMEGIEEGAIFTPLHKMQNKKELEEELARQKEYYRPFFENLAPKLPDMRKRITLTDCRWREGTAEDCQDFVGILEGKGKWERRSLPHYGEPRGTAVTYYRMTFELLREDLQRESLWAVFHGVDYKAHVFMNGMYLGSHEGFFAPFEFEFTYQAKEGENVLCVMVENDYIQMGSVSKQNGEMFTGNKFYAASGLGYDDPYEGWYACPPGMGIYQDVFIEMRNAAFISDIYVRPKMKEKAAELWLELYDCQVEHREIQLDLSVYGQNFEETVIQHMRYIPETGIEVGMGDSLTEAKLIAEGKLGSGIVLKLEKGINYLKIPLAMKNIRVWEPNQPWLYQVQVCLLDSDGTCLDTGMSQFGMREIRMDENSMPKGKFYLNGREIRLRGVNSMGFEQQCVFRKDWNQLYTDLILAKICRVNFIRLTQRPVQQEVYDYCDRLGLLLQTDFPMFGAMRRNQFAEGIRQVQEMEHLIRSHASAAWISYINEPMPNAKNMPHRCLTRKELEDFFACADIAVHLLNPDRVIKHVDGDYDPPTEGYPDNHCYPCWYNGHGIDIGRLYRGYWMPVKEGWYYGCGEYGIEGLDNISVMKKYYPEEWLPQEGKEEQWTPDVIPGVQSGSFHYFYYETPRTLQSWIDESQRYQAMAVTVMTEAYRRDNRMNSFAYHLFISAFPNGWCKTLMDVDRNPKQAFFSYRNALAPVLVSLRADRRKGFSGEEISVECWICNDTQDRLDGAVLHYQVIVDKTIIAAHTGKTDIVPCGSRFQGFLQVKLPEVTKRTACSIQVGLQGTDGQMIDTAQMELEAFPKQGKNCKVCFLGEKTGRWKKMEEDLAWEEVSLDDIETGDTILVKEYALYEEKKEIILTKVRQAGCCLLFLELPEGSYKIGNSRVEAKNCSMLPLHFASRDTGHPLVKDFQAEDIRYWYDADAGYITPLLETTIEAKGYTPILTSGNQDQNGCWRKTLAAAEVSFGDGKIRICQVKLAGRTAHNPIARELAFRLLSCGEPCTK